MNSKEELELINYARQLIEHDAQAIAGIADKIDANFPKAVLAISNIATQGHVIVSGMGKTGIIGMKISATLASIGIPSFFLHPAEAIHGDLGRFTSNDLALLLSNSGETEEVVRIIAPIKKIGCKIMSITAEATSTLAKASDTCLLLGQNPEAGPLGLAPTTSTSMMLAYGDVLAMAAVKHKKISIEEFAFYHPGGSLGRALIPAGEIMRTGDRLCIVEKDEITKNVIQKIAATPGRPGAAAVVDRSGALVGVFTDGDMRNQLSLGYDFLDKPVSLFMGRSPKVVSCETVAQDILKLLRKHCIDQVIVTDSQNLPRGMIDIQDLI